MKTSDFDVVHWVWDDNPDETLCGKDVAGEAWASNDNPITCQGCLEIELIILESERLEINA